MTDATTDNRSSGNSMEPLLLAGAWLFVGIPLAWGVWNVIKTSLALFK
jgi:hypothetical protein